MPVIYLGLKRLFPLAQESNVNIDISDLSKQEIQFFEENHNDILLLDEKIIPEKVYTRNKQFYAPQTKKYDHLGNSAGQDNIGQILSALLSFERFQKLYPENYDGGILLIDEIESTLYPAAQIKLVEKLIHYSGKLNLQIIFTTHSIDVLETLFKEKYRYHNKIVFLDNKNGSVSIPKDISLINILCNLRVEVPIMKNPLKTNVYVEDNEAKSFLVKLLPIELRRKISIINENFGGDLLLTLAKKKIPEFQRSLIILDGDKRNELKRTRIKNIVILPSFQSPERLFFDFLKNLSPKDDFWNSTNGYSKQFCFKNLNRIGNREKMKNWFNEQLPYWGQNATKLINRWKQDNSKYTENFIKEFEKALNNVRN